MWFIASSLFTFQVCTTRFNNKQVFWTFCLSCGKGLGFTWSVGQELQVLSWAREWSCRGMSMLLLSHSAVTLAHATGTLREHAKLFCLKFISAEAHVFT